MNKRPIAGKAKLPLSPDRGPIGHRIGGMIAAFAVSFSRGSTMVAFHLRLLALDLPTTGHKPLLRNGVSRPAPDRSSNNGAFRTGMPP